MRTIVPVPAAEVPNEGPSAEEARVSETPMPPPMEDIDDEEVETKVTSSGAKPAPLKPTRAVSDGDDDDDFDDRPCRRRRMDEDEEDYLDVRSRRSPANSQATTAMTCGIVSLVMSTVGACCCGLFGDIIAITCGGVALAFGLSCKRKNSAATTGVICGGVGLALGILLLILRLTVIGFQVAGGQLFNFKG